MCCEIAAVILATRQQIGQDGNHHLRLPAMSQVQSTQGSLVVEPFLHRTGVQNPGWWGAAGDRRAARYAGQLRNRNRSKNWSKESGTSQVQNTNTSVNLQLWLKILKNKAFFLVTTRMSDVVWFFVYIYIY